MSEEFARQFKRLFAVLSAYGWMPQMETDMDGIEYEYALLETNSHPWRIYWLSFHPERRLPFMLSGDDIVNRSYRHEDSLLAALFRIHTGQKP